MNCIICGVDDGLAVCCGRHWAEYRNATRAAGYNGGGDGSPAVPSPSDGRSPASRPEGETSEHPPSDVSRLTWNG